MGRICGVSFFCYSLFVASGLLFLTSCKESTDPGTFYQNLPAHVSLANIKKLLKGGEEIVVELDGIPVEMRAKSDLRVEFSTDRNTFVLLATLPGTARTYLWQVPKIDAKEAVLRIVYSDLNGKRSETLSNVFEIRTRLPGLTLDNSPTEKGEHSSVLAHGACETGLPVSVKLLSGDGLILPTSVSCPGGTWSLPLNATTDGIRNVGFKQVDEVGHEKELFFTWTRQTVLPEVDSSYFKVENGAAITSSNYVKIDFKATDNTRVTHFCLLYNQTTVPSAQDGCWLPVDGTPPGQTAAASVEFNGFYYRLGAAKGNYKVRAYARDYAGNVSTTYGERTIQYLPPVPPDLSFLIASNTAAPTSLSIAETTIPKDQNVFIKWRMENKDLSAPVLSNPISLYYTTNDIVWTSIAENLLNGSNFGCEINNPGTTLDDQATGCFLWNKSPTNAYFRIRVQAANQKPGSSGEKGAIVFGQTNALNLPNFKFIAGNTEAGMGGVATKAAFLSGGKQALVVHPSGRMFIYDRFKGIVTIDPADGNAKVYLPLGTAVVDGQIGVARVKNVGILALDFQGNVLMTDDKVIRRIRMDQNPIVVETIIGGGSLLDDVVNPLDLKILTTAQPTLLTALPNGDIYFLSDQFAQVGGNSNGLPQDYKIRYFDHSDGKVKAFSPRSNGKIVQMNGNDVSEIEKCALVQLGLHFNPVTSSLNDMILMLNRTASGPCQKSGDSTPQQYADYVPLDPSSKTPNQKKIAYQAYFHADQERVGLREYSYVFAPGMNGKLYAISNFTRGNSLVNRLESDGTWTKVLGTGVRGVCQDGTSALSCPVSISSIFVDARGTVYFVDRRAVRMIQDDGKVLTLAGERSDYGDGQNALNARFNDLTSFDLYRDGSGVDQFAVVDSSEFRIRKFSEIGLVSTIAGNGADEVDTVNPTGPAMSRGISFGVDAPNPFLSIDPLNGNLWTTRIQNNSPFILNLAGDWVKAGPASVGGYGPMVLANSPTKVLVGTFAYCGTLGSTCNPRLYEYEKTTGTRTTLLSTSNNVTLDAFCADGSSLNDCTMRATGYISTGITQGQYNAYHGAWLLKERNSTRIVKLDGSGTMKTFVTLPDPQPARQADDFAYYRSNDGSVENTFYCASSKLYKYDHRTGLNTSLPFPVASMSCQMVGRLVYSEARRSLIFTYLFQGLSGVAEVLNP